MTPSVNNQTSAFTPPEELQASDVWVFACSPDGLHGCDDAGWAFKGTATADWYSNAEYRSMVASPSRKGYRAVWGRGEGWHSGRRGDGYAIPVALAADLSVANLKQEVPSQYRARLRHGIEKFLVEAQKHSQRRFVVAPIGVKAEFGGAGML